MKIFLSSFFSAIIGGGISGIAILRARSSTDSTPGAFPNDYMNPNEAPTWFSTFITPENIQKILKHASTIEGANEVYQYAIIGLLTFAALGYTGSLYRTIFPATPPGLDQLGNSLRDLQQRMDHNIPPTSIDHNPFNNNNIARDFLREQQQSQQGFLDAMQQLGNNIILEIRRAFSYSSNTAARNQPVNLPNYPPIFSPASVNATFNQPPTAFNAAAGNIIPPIIDYSSDGQPIYGVQSIPQVLQTPRTPAWLSGSFNQFSNTNAATTTAVSNTNAATTTADAAATATAPIFSSSSSSSFSSTLNSKVLSGIDPIFGDLNPFNSPTTPATDVTNVASTSALRPLHINLPQSATTAATAAQTRPVVVVQPDDAFGSPDFLPTFLDRIRMGMRVQPNSTFSIRPRVQPAPTAGSTVQPTDPRDPRITTSTTSTSTDTSIPVRQSSLDGGFTPRAGVLHSSVSTTPLSPYSEFDMMQQEASTTSHTTSSAVSELAAAGARMFGLE